VARALAATAAALLASLLIAATAHSATHTYNSYYHGIVWADGCCAGDLRSFIDDQGRAWNQLWAYGYHYTSIGTWQERCGNYSRAAIYLSCRFDAGNHKCTKYAWVAGDSASRVLNWHGHNPADGC
jgi:hypothetical protein